MSAITDRLSEKDFRELARLVRQTHARAAAKRERLRREQEGAASPGAAAGDDDHDPG